MLHPDVLEVLFYGLGGFVFMQAFFLCDTGQGWPRRFHETLTLSKEEENFVGWTNIFIVLGVPTMFAVCWVILVGAPPKATGEVLNLQARLLLTSLGWPLGYYFRLTKFLPQLPPLTESEPVKV